MRLILRTQFLEWHRQDNSTYFKNVGRTIERMILSNIFQASQQHCCMTTAGMLQVSKIVALTSQQALISSYVKYKQIVLRRDQFVCMLCIYSAPAFDDFSFSPFHKLQRCYKMCSKAYADDKIFHLKVAAASSLISGDVLAMEAIYNFYIRITQTIMQVQNPLVNLLSQRNQVQKKLKKHWPHNS